MIFQIVASIITPHQVILLKWPSILKVQNLISKYLQLIFANKGTNRYLG